MAVAAKDSQNQSGACVLGEDATFTGRIEGRDVTILGRFEGTLQLMGRLRIGRSARVEAKVNATIVEVNGEFIGDIQARSLVFGEMARAQGSFLSDRLGMREGASVTGAFQPLESAEKAGATLPLASRSTPPEKPPQKEALLSQVAAPQAPVSPSQSQPGNHLKPATTESATPPSPPIPEERTPPTNAAAKESQDPDAPSTETADQVETTQAVPKDTP